MRPEISAETIERLGKFVSAQTFKQWGDSSHRRLVLRGTGQDYSGWTIDDAIVELLKLAGF